MNTTSAPLSNIQIELLKLFSTNLSDGELKELKGVLAEFYARKSIQWGNQIWIEKGLTSKNMDDWLNERSE